MPVKSTQAKRVSPKLLQKATDGLTTLSKITTYKPQRLEFDPKNIAPLQATLKATGDAERDAEIALNKARDAANKAEWAVYNFMLGAAEQVAGQYGSDSDEYASIGYKKKSEYKKSAPGSKAKKGGTGNP